MKLTSEQLKLVQGCTSAEELLSKAKAEGFEMTLAQAESFLGASAFAELGEDSLDCLSGGCDTSEGFDCAACKHHFDGKGHMVRYSGSAVYFCDSCYENKVARI